MVKLKGKIFNILLIISLLIFLLVVFVIFFKEDNDIIPYQSALLKNVVKIEGVDLLYIIDNDTYIKLQSEYGNVNIINYNIDLINLNIVYTGKNFQIDARAEKGQYLSSRFVKAYDNITGYMDNMSFETGTSGILEYDYTAGKGVVKNDVIIHQENNSISSNYVEFDVNNNYIMFRDNVTVDYTPEQG